MQEWAGIVSKLSKVCSVIPTYLEQMDVICVRCVRISAITRQLTYPDGYNARIEF